MRDIRLSDRPVEIAWDAEYLEQNREWTTTLADVDRELLWSDAIHHRWISADTVRAPLRRFLLSRLRTFGFVHELDYLKKINRGHGASLENTLAIDGDVVLNKEKMRFPDEFVRHKILDAIGDMALAGAPLIARFEGVKSGHATNNLVLKALFADSANYSYVDAA